MPSASSATPSSRRTPPSCSGVPIDGVEPDYEAISSGKYKGARPLFVYVKKQHVGVVPGIDKFVAEYVSAKAMSKDGYLAAQGSCRPAEGASSTRSMTDAKGMKAPGCQRREVTRCSDRPPSARRIAGGAPHVPTSRPWPRVRAASAKLERSAGAAAEGWRSMAGYYFLTLAALVVVRLSCWAAAGGRACGGGARRRPLHSLPAYHGLFAAAAVVSCRCCVVFAVGAPLIGRFANRRASHFCPQQPPTSSSAAPAARRAESGRRAALRRSLARAAGGSRHLRRARCWWQLVPLRRRRRARRLGALGSAFAHRLAFPRPQHFRALRHSSCSSLCAPVAILTTIGIVFSVAVRDLSLLLRSRIKGGRRSPSSCSAPIGTRKRRCAPTRARSDRVRLRSAARRHAAHHLHRHLRGGAAGAVLGDLSCRVRQPRIRACAKPMLEILAGIPTVVLGFFAALTVAPFIRGWGESSVSTLPPRARWPPVSSWA